MERQTVLTDNDINKICLQVHETSTRVSDAHGLFGSYVLDPGSLTASEMGDAILAIRYDLQVIMDIVCGQTAGDA